MDERVSNLKGHYIVCGAGVTGFHASKYLQKEKAGFVVIDKDETQLRKLIDYGMLCLLGDATFKDTLNKASISKARGLLACLPRDFDNIIVTLTAKTINSRILMVSKVADNDCLLRRAGADHTYSPSEIAGVRLASYLLKPAAVSFLDNVTRYGDISFAIEEFVLGKGSLLVGKTVRDYFTSKKELFVLYIKKHRHENLINAFTYQEKLQEGDMLVVLGTEKQLKELRATALER